jgi:hypothetical protein
MKIKGLSYSASSNNVLFGQKFVHHIKDFSMNPKINIYQQDGLGRDTYIKFPNGGFCNNWSNNYKKIYTSNLQNYMKSSKISPKFPIYKTSGNGRDMYIYYNCGGFYNKNYNENSYRKYIGGLRRYEYDPYVNNSVIIKKNDYGRYSRLFKSPKEILLNNKLANKQRATSARLARPKFFYK